MRISRKAAALSAALSVGVALTGTVASGFSFTGDAKPSRPTPTAKPTPTPTEQPQLWPAAGAPVPPATNITFGRCDDPGLREHGAECGLASVPLDYGAPNDRKIELNVARIAASGEKQGTLFINPGGPGGAATAKLGRFTKTLGPEVMEHFDVIAMDPRGVGDDAIAGCYSLDPEPAMGEKFPNTDEEIATRLAHEAYQRESCTKSGLTLLNHMTTGDVARDMELLRRALGDDPMTYYGVSYGSVLGATYANMFPSSVRAIAVDGVVDPIAWSTGYGDDAKTRTVGVRDHDGEGAEESLRALFQACRDAGVEKCPHGPTIESEWDQLTDKLAKGPVKVGDTTVRLGDVVVNVLGNLYDPYLFEVTVNTIHQDYLAVVKGEGKPSTDEGLEEEGDEESGADAEATDAESPWGIPAPTPSPTPDPAPTGDPDFGVPDNVEWYDTFKMDGVTCSDTANPSDPQAVPRYAQKMIDEKKYFGAAWAWNTSICSGWPATPNGRYTGPFDKELPNGMLVIGNTHDPSTPLKGAQALAKMSPGARLVTVDMFGHIAGADNKCSVNTLRNYLTTGELPSEDVFCEAEMNPFFLE